MRLLRRAAPLVIAATLACTGRVEPPPAAPPQPPGGAAPAGKAEPPPADPADALAATLTEEKLGRLLALEEEVLPLTANLIALASLPGAGSRVAPGEPSREDRVRAVEARVDAALARRGLTRADRAGFAALLSGIVQRSAGAESDREQLAALAETRKRAGGARSKGLPGGDRTQPEAVARALRERIALADAERTAFAARHGDAVLALLDRRRSDLLALREKQVRTVLSASATAR